MFYRVLGEPQIASDLGPGGVPISLAIWARGGPYCGGPHIAPTPVFVGTKKKIILRAAAHESFSLVKPRELEQPSRFEVQTRNTCSLPNSANG